jgi:methanogenic corrinoid protein MtbC1
VSDKELRAQLIERITRLDEIEAVDLVRQRLLAGDDPLAILEDCNAGMRQVGLYYEAREYFISGLIMAGEIFRQIMLLLQPSLAERIVSQESGCILLGTVKGDIHEMGKNIVSMLLQCYGFKVVDLGADVEPQTFAEMLAIHKPDVIGISVVMSNAYEALRETIAQIRNASSTLETEIPVLLGGGAIDEQVFSYVGADAWTNDAMDGVTRCKQWLEAARSG